MHFLVVCGRTHSVKPAGLDKEFVKYRRATYIRQQDLGEKYRRDTNDYLLRFCTESILGATVLLGFISDWITGGSAGSSLLRAASICAWLSILLSIGSGAWYLIVSVKSNRHYAKLYERYCNAIDESVSIDDIQQKYVEIFANQPRSMGDPLLVVQGVLFAIGAVALSVALVFK